MASIGEKAISILVGNLNLGRSYLITTVNVQIVTVYILRVNENELNLVS